MFGFMKKKSSDPTAEAKQKKSKGYYLELDEAKSVGTAPAPLATDVEVSEPVQTEVTSSEDKTDAALIVPATAPKTEAKTEAKTETAPVAPAKAPKTAAKAPKPEAKTEAKIESKPAPEPVAIATPEILPAYLQPNNTPRRRPGANMAMFKNMAQKIKNP